MAHSPRPCFARLREGGSAVTAPAGTARPPSTPEAVRRRNRELYDQTDSALWELAVYRGMHAGRRFINLGGEAMLRRIVARAGLADDAETTPGGAGSGAAGEPGGGATGRILDLGAGTGAVAAWLAETTGGEVTAVEINPRQAERVRASAAQVRRGRVSVVEDDAVKVRFSHPFDLVLTLDTLMLVPDWPAFLASARAAMAPHALFSASTFLGGGLSAPERDFFAGEDGMINLPGAGEATGLLQAAGLAVTAREDMTDIAMAAIRRLDLALAQHRDDIVQAAGADAPRLWAETNGHYLRALGQNRLQYVLIHARTG